MNARIAAILLSFSIACSAAPAGAADQPAPGAKRGTPVSVGDTPPDFTLEDQDGRKVTLSAEWKARPVVLIFYRGHW